MASSGRLSDAALAVINAVGGDLTGEHCPCPVCGHRSMSIKNGNKKPVVVHCFRCGKEGGDAIVNKLKSMGVWGKSMPNVAQTKSNQDLELEIALESYDEFRKAWAILRVAAGSVGSPNDWKPAERPTEYLKHRGIDIVPEGAMFLTSPHAMKLKDKIDGFKDFPAMVMPIVGADGLQGASITYLTRDGTRNAFDGKKNVRRIYGKKSGGYVQLGVIDDDNENLIVSEGIEDGLAALLIADDPDLPAIAALGSEFPSDLPSCKSIIIAADNDEDGLGKKKAEQAASVWVAEGKWVQIAIPPKHKDWNEAIRDPEADQKELRELLLHAEPVKPDVDDDNDHDKKKEKQALVLANLVPTGGPTGGLFRTKDQEGYADIVLEGHRETLRIKSPNFRQWLLHRYFLATRETPTSEALRSAIELIDAKAKFETGVPVREIYIRVGKHDGKIYLDLCDDQWRAVEISQNGWHVVNDPPLRFHRASGMRSLPVPVTGGSLETLRSFVNLKSDGPEPTVNDPDFVLLVSWLLAGLRYPGPYPILKLWGEPGSAKSTLVRLLRELIDPHKVTKRRLPSSDRDLFIAANNAWVLSYDNVSHIQEWLSNSLCSLATGGGFATRTLYTDQDEQLFEATRPVVINSVENFITKHDLADREIALELPLITDRGRRLEDEFWAAFEAKQPEIIGALLDMVVYGLKALPNTEAEDWPRMADFAHWITACEGAVWEGGTFRQAYRKNRRKATMSAIEDDPVANALHTFIVKEREWEGTTARLLAALTAHVGEAQSKSKKWPTEPRALTSHLQQAKGSLRKIGIEISAGRRANKGRVYTISYAPPKPKGFQQDPHKVPVRPSQPSQPSQRPRLRRARE